MKKIEGGFWRFDGGYCQLQWDASKNTAYPENDLPYEDFYVEMEFSTEDETGALFCLYDSTLSYQRQLYMREGKI